MDDDKFDTRRFQIQDHKYDNYYFWSNDMEFNLREKELWKYGAETVTAPTETTEKATKAMHEKESDMCLSYVLLSIDQSCKFVVMMKRDSNDVWTTLQTTYEKGSESLIDSKLTQLQEI